MSMSNGFHHIKYFDISGEEVPRKQALSENYIILARKIYFFKISKPCDKQTA